MITPTIEQFIREEKGLAKDHPPCVYASLRELWDAGFKAGEPLPDPAGPNGHFWVQQSVYLTDHNRKNPRKRRCEYRGSQDAAVKSTT